MIVPLGGVVVHVPAAAFELKAGSGQSAMERAAALGALRQRSGVEMLNFLKTMATGGAAVRIEGQGRLPRNKNLLSSILRQTAKMCARGTAASCEKVTCRRARGGGSKPSSCPHQAIGPCGSVTNPSAAGRDTRGKAGREAGVARAQAPGERRSLAGSLGVERFAGPGRVSVNGERNRGGYVLPRERERALAAGGGEGIGEVFDHRRRL